MMNMSMVKIVIGATVLILLTTNSVLSASPWWDASRQFRIPVTVGSAGFERYDKPVDVSINFTQIVNDLGKTGTLDENSIRVVETDSVGTILDTSVKFQFDKDLGYDATTKASGMVVFVMNGTTLSSINRYYHIYFNLTGGSFSPLVVSPMVTLTDNVIDEGMSSYQIDNINGTFYFQKQAGGFSSWNDTSGNDWIGWNNVYGSAGIWRGIPNAVYALGIFHPGFNCCTSTIVSQGPIKIRIRSVNGTDWETIWDFYPKYATMTMTKINSSVGYWMLYEGTPGGKLDPNKDYMYRSNGVKTYLNKTWNGDMTGDEWAYFTDPSVGRSLFLAHHDNDLLTDTYRPLQNNMTVFGFGRNETRLRGLLTSVPQRLTIGLIDEVGNGIGDGTGFTQNAKIINSAYKNLSVVKGVAEEYGNNGGNNNVTDPIQLTFNGSIDRQPAWSSDGPDGQWLAFTSNRNGGWGVYKMKIDGSSLTMLNNSGSSLEPSWYPMDRILFSIAKPGSEDVYVMNNDGTNRIRLTNTAGYDEYPDWSPDGTKVVYTSAGGIVGGTKYIWIMNADGSGKYRLSTQSGIQPAWSPDGTKITFKCYMKSSTSTSNNNICMINANGTGLKRLTNETANAHDPDWNPDGTKVVFASNRDGDWEIYTMSTNGSNVQKLTSNVGIDDNYPVYSPDGQWLAFASNRTGNEEIWIMKVGDSQTSPIFSITSSSPTTNPTTTIGNSQTFEIALNKDANITWYVNGFVVKTDSGMMSNYTDIGAGIGTYIVNVTATNGTVTRSKEWTWTVQDVPGYITVTSPNGGENWVAGTTNLITWTYIGNPGSNVKIELLNGSVVDKVITAGTPNDGSHSWTIYWGQYNGSNYKIRVTSMSDSSYSDTSDSVFNITGTTLSKANLKINIVQGFGNVEIFKNDSNIWTSLGNSTVNATYVVISGTQINITATPGYGYNFERWVTDKGYILTINPLVVYQKYSGGLNTYFNVT